MPLPQPELDLVVYYGLVWSGADRRPPPDAGKDRPCLIVDLFELEEPPDAKPSGSRIFPFPIPNLGTARMRSSSAPGPLEHFTIRLTISGIEEICRTLASREI